MNKNSEHAEMDGVIIRLAQQGLRASDLLEQANRLLSLSPQKVRCFVQNRYPGLLIPAAAERSQPTDRPLKNSGQHRRIKGKHGDVYSLPSRKLSGGYTF